MIRLIFTVFFIISLPFISIGQESAASSQTEDIERIINTVPFDEMLEESPKDLRQQFSQNPFGISTSDNQQLIELFSKAFDADSLSQVARDHFTENFDPKYASAVLEDLKSEAITPAIEAESDFYSVQGIRKQIVTKYELEQDKPSEDRIALIEEIMDHRSGNETEIESQEILLRAFVTGTDKISSDLSLGESQVEAIVDNFKSRMQIQLDDQLKNNYLVMYHRLSNDQLNKYADFYESEAGKEFKDSVAEAIHAAFQKGSDQFLSTIESR